MDLGESTHNLPDLSQLRKQLGRTATVYSQLMHLATADGTLKHTLAQLARALQMSRQQVSKHLAKLRAYGLLLNPEDVSCDGNGRWRRKRTLLPLAYARGFQTPDRVGFQTPPEVSKPPLNDSIHVCNEYGEKKTHNPKGWSDSQVCTRSSAAAAPLLTERSTASRSPVGGEMNEDLTMILEAGEAPRPVDLAHLPPYPAAKLYPTIKYPRMPRLTGDKAGDARLLTRAYKAATLHKYGKRSRVDKQAHFRMRTAAAAMHKHGIESPFAWAGFRLVCWSLSEKSSKKPSIDYVFSAKVIEQHAAQFRRKQSTYDVLSRVKITPSHERLLKLWETARRAAMRRSAGDPGEEATRRAVSAILPDGLYRELASKIEEERATAEAELYRRLAQGEWIW